MVSTDNKTLLQGFLNMLLYLTFLLGVFGASNCIAFLHIGKPIRNALLILSEKDFKVFWISSVSNVVFGFLHKLSTCHACVGFWIGMALSYWYLYDVLPCIVISLSASAFNFIIWTLLVKLDVHQL